MNDVIAVDPAASMSIFPESVTSKFDDVRETVVDERRRRLAFTGAAPVLLPMVMEFAYNSQSPVNVINDDDPRETHAVPATPRFRVEDGIRVSVFGLCECVPLPVNEAVLNVPVNDAIVNNPEDVDVNVKVGIWNRTQKDDNFLPHIHTYEKKYVTI